MTSNTTSPRCKTVQNGSKNKDISTLRHINSGIKPRDQSLSGSISLSCLYIQCRDITVVRLHYAGWGRGKLVTCLFVGEISQNKELKWKFHRQWLSEQSCSSFQGSSNFRIFAAGRSECFSPLPIHVGIS